MFMCIQYTFPVHNISLDMAFEALQSEEVFNFCKTPSPSPPDLAFVFLQGMDLGIDSKIYLNYAVRRIGYILDDTGRSFVVDVGQNYPQRPRDRGISCSPRPATCNSVAFKNPHPNPYLLIGALVASSNSYTDDHQHDRVNRVSLNDNAGLLRYRMKKLI